MKTRSVLSHTRRLVGLLLDLRGVTDESPLGRAAHEAIQILEGVVDEVEASGDSSLVDSGPLVYPIPGEDPRDYPSSRGGTVRETLLGKAVEDHPSLARFADSGLFLKAPSDAENAKVLTWRQYLSVLRRSRPQGNRELVSLVN